MTKIANKLKDVKDVICFTGPPGSGKGTHSYRCFQKYKHKLNMHRFSVGDEVRLLKADKPNGALVDPALVESIIDQNLAKPHQSFIIDGYPRSTEQMHMLVRKKNLGVIKNITIFNLNIPNVEVLFDRLEKRNNCNQCGYTDSTDMCPKCDLPMSKRRDDMKLTAMQNRISIYYEFYDKIKAIAEENNIPIHNFNASDNIAETFSAIESKLLSICALG